MEGEKPGLGHLPICGAQRPTEEAILTPSDVPPGQAHMLFPCVSGTVPEAGASPARL